MTYTPIPAKVAMTRAAAQPHEAATVLAPVADAALDLTIFISCYNEAPYIIDKLAELILPEPLTPGPRRA
jgi:hypothetical protein